MKNNDLFEFTIDGKTIRKSAIDSVIIQLLFRMRGIITMPVLTYCLAPAEIGVFNIISVTAAMLVPVFSLNLTDGPAIFFVQEKSRARIADMYNTVVNTVIVISLACSFALWLASLVLVPAYRDYIFGIILLILSGVLFKAVSYLLAVFQKTSVLVRNTVIRDGLSTVLTVALVLLGFSYKGMVVAVVIGNVIGAVLIWRLVRTSLPYRFILDRKILVQFLKTAIPLLPVFFFSWVVQSSDSYFLAYFHGQQSVGKYAVIYGLTSVILSITFALNYFWFPVSARMWVENRKRYMEVFTCLFAGLLAVLLMGVCLFELNSVVIMKIFVRQTAYRDAHVIMGIIAFAFVMQVLITLLTAPLYSNRNMKAILFAYLAGGILNAALNIILVPGTGIIGAAVSTALSYLAVVVVMGLLNYNLAQFSFADRRLKYIIPVFLAIWVFMGWTREHVSLVGLVLANLIFIAVSTVALYKSMSGNEREYLVAMVTNLWTRQKAGS